MDKTKLCAAIKAYESFNTTLDDAIAQSLNKPQTEANRIMNDWFSTSDRLKREVQVEFWHLTKDVTKNTREESPT